MIIDYKAKRAWAEINLDRLKQNFKYAGKNVCCVVKANAYGHGSSFLAPFFESLGAMYLAVSNIEEAIQLRRNNVKIPILILGYTPVECAVDLFKYDIEQTIYCERYAIDLNKQAIAFDVKLKIHIKIDTGMGRIGFQYHDNVDELNQALTSCRLSNLQPVGIFTHFASSDECVNNYTRLQYTYFIQACDFFKKNGIYFTLKHCSNSAALLNYPNYSLDMARTGILLYGIKPSKTDVDLKPALSLWSVVSNIKTVHKGDSISYGRTYIAPKDMVVATIPIGYADGFWRSNQGHCVFINGKYCTIIGRICMDQIMVECDDAKIGDLVEIYGEHISVQEVAEYNHTIPYEVLCAIGARIPRVYRENGKIIEVVDKLV